VGERPLLLANYGIIIVIVFPRMWSEEFNDDFGFTPHHNRLHGRTANR
jgi:hypothetical protein